MLYDLSYFVKITHIFTDSANFRTPLYIYIYSCGSAAPCILISSAGLILRIDAPRGFCSFS